MPTNVVSTVLVALGAVGGTSGLIALFNVFSTNAKLKAESDKLKAEASTADANAESVRLNAGVVISQAALNQMNAAIEQSGRDAAKALQLASLNDSLESRVVDLEAQLRAYRRLAEIHQDWDLQMVQEVRNLGGHPTDPPPLIPSLPGGSA